MTVHMGTLVAQTEFDSSPHNGPEWTIKVVRLQEGVVYGDVLPRPEDLPQDVLRAIREWADGGIPKDAEGPENDAEDVSEPDPWGDDDADRCAASSWRGNVAQPVKNPKYHHLYGPGGYNRCIKSVDAEGRHPGLHQDEWGNLFEHNPATGYFRVRSQISHPFGTED